MSRDRGGELRSKRSATRASDDATVRRAHSIGQVWVSALNRTESSGCRAEVSQQATVRLRPVHDKGDDPETDGPNT